MLKLTPEQRDTLREVVHFALASIPEGIPPGPGARTWTIGVLLVLAELPAEQISEVERALFPKSPRPQGRMPPGRKRRRRTSHG